VRALGPLLTLIGAKLLPCGRMTSPCLASSRLAVKVLVQADRAITSLRDALSWAAGTCGRSWPSVCAFPAAAKSCRMRAHASATECSAICLGWQAGVVSARSAGSSTARGSPIGTRRRRPPAARRGMMRPLPASRGRTRRGRVAAFGPARPPGLAPDRARAAGRAAGRLAAGPSAAPAWPREAACGSAAAPQPGGSRNCHSAVA